MHGMEAMASAKAGKALQNSKHILTEYHKNISRKSIKNAKINQSEISYFLQSPIQTRNALILNCQRQKSNQQTTTPYTL